MLRSELVALLLVVAAAPSLCLSAAQLRDGALAKPASSALAGGLRGDNQAIILAKATNKNVKHVDEKVEYSGAIAKWSGITRIPVDPMVTFGAMGFVLGYAKKATIVFCGLVGVLAQNGYVDINWDRAEHDVMGGTKTYKKITLHKESVLHRLPKDVKDNTVKTMGKMQTAAENNGPGLILGAISFLLGFDIGRKERHPQLLEECKVF